jgi:toxin YoeB
MSYHLNFSQQAQNDIGFYKKTGNKVVLKKLLTLLTEISEHPYTGTGKPEALKYNFTGLWSRRINQEHRLVYEVLDDQVLIHSAKGHYLQ